MAREILHLLVIGIYVYMFSVPMQVQAMVILTSSHWIVPTTPSMAGESTHSVNWETCYSKEELNQSTILLQTVLLSSQPLHLEFPTQLLWSENIMHIIISTCIVYQHIDFIHGMGLETHHVSP